MVRGPKLPFDLIVMILENLSYDKVFTFDDGEVLHQTLLAKLNHGHSLDESFLQSLSKYPQIYSRLARMDVSYVDSEDRWGVLKGILEQCPNLRSLDLKLSVAPDLSVFEECPQILQRLRKLDVCRANREEDLILIRTTCERSPNLGYLRLSHFAPSGLKILRNVLPNLGRLAEIVVNLEDKKKIDDEQEKEYVSLLEELCDRCSHSTLEIMTGSSWRKIRHSHQILRRLKKLRLHNVEMDNFLLLDSICARYTIFLDLETDICLRHLLEYPAMLRQLAGLTLRSLSKEEIIWLNNHETFPQLRDLTVKEMTELQTLTNCTFVQDILSGLYVNLLSEKDVFLFNEISKLCQNLRQYEVQIPFRLLKCFQNFPEEACIHLSITPTLIGPCLV